MLGSSFPAMDGATPMPKTQALMADKGSTATSFYIHTPICCPSRSELLSGRYFHNIKKTGGGCMHTDGVKVNNATFARNLHEGGYRVGMFGKYLNTVPKEVPPGFDAWLANGGGNYIAPEFSTKNIDGLPDGTWHGSQANYRFGGH
jgi:N-acetylglucosamine-6-sulfatase